MVSSEYIPSLPREFCFFLLFLLLLWPNLCYEKQFIFLPLSSSHRGTGEGAAFPKAAVMRTTDHRARPIPSLEFLIFTSTSRAAALFFKGTLWYTYNHLSNLYLIQFYTDKSFISIYQNKLPKKKKKAQQKLYYQPKNVVASRGR